MQKEGGGEDFLSFTSHICNWDKMIFLNEKKNRIILMLGRDWNICIDCMIISYHRINCNVSHKLKIDKN